MNTAPITIYEAKTNFSKLVKRAAAGETVLIGAFGKPEVMLVAAKPAKKAVQFGAWKNKEGLWYDESEFVQADHAIQTMFGSDYGLSD